MNQRQQRVLVERLHNISRAKEPVNWFNDAKPKEPVTIQRARKKIEELTDLVNKFEKLEREKFEKRKESKTRFWNACTQTIAFGTAEEAIAAIDKFEKTKF